MWRPVSGFEVLPSCLSLFPRSGGHEKAAARAYTDVYPYLYASSISMISLCEDRLWILNFRLEWTSTWHLIAISDSVLIWFITNRLWPHLESLQRSNFTTHYSLTDFIRISVITTRAYFCTITHSIKCFSLLRVLQKKHYFQVGIGYVYLR